MSGARQPSPWLKPYKLANNRKVLKLCRRPSNCEHFATRLRFTVSTPPIQASALTADRAVVRVADVLAALDVVRVRRRALDAAVVREDRDLGKHGERA